MKFTILFIPMIISLYSYSQDEQEKIPANYISLSAGLQTAQIGKPVLGIAYRHAINEQWWFNTGFSFNAFQGKQLMDDSLLYADNTIRIYRDQGQFNRSYLVNAGIRYSPIRYFNVGLDLIFGYNQSNVSITDNARTYDSSENTWVWNNAALRDYYPDLFSQSANDDHSSGNTRTSYNAYLGYANYLVTGASLSLGACVPIGDRWEVGLTYTTSFLLYSYLNNNAMVTDLNYDGKTVYPGIENIVTEPPSFNLWNNSLSLSVGFGF